MAEVVKMIRYSEQSPDPRKEAFQYSETLASPGNGKWILRPAAKFIMSAILKPETGSGYIEVVIDELEKIENDTADNIMTWPEGIVTGITQGTFTNVKALRQVNVSGTTILTVEA